MQAGITPAEAKELLRLHRETYRPFWRWIGDMVSSAMLTNKMQTVFGWRRRVGRDANPRSLMNFPMQAQRGGNDADCCDCGHRGRYTGVRPGS